MNKNKIVNDEIKVLGELSAGYEAVLTKGALQFLAALTAEFQGTINELMSSRGKRQTELDAGQMPDFLEESADIRAGDWRVCKAPPDLLDRRVEITGPTDRKIIINALNSGARVFMADCEDALSPTWDNVIQGQINLRDAIDQNIEFESGGKHYVLNDKVATLIVRPRGLHLEEQHLQLDGKPVPASLVDFGLFLFHNANALAERGTGPYFYLPKLEGRLEARLWADVFQFAEARGLVEPNQIRATVLIENILAAFEIDEILYELRDYIVGMNCGRWDYIFSFIKKFRAHPGFVLPDRAEVTMTSHFLRSYTQLLIQTCHRRGAHAIGGMAAQIPVRDDPEANDLAIARVRADKEREVSDGHDGTWVAHPALVPIANEIFDRVMPGPNQLDVQHDDVNVTAEDLLQGQKGKITENGVRKNISVAIRYMAAWLDGNGCVPINHLMEDAATAEISRAQLWQWVHHATGILDEGRNVTMELVRQFLLEEMDKIRDSVGEDAFLAGQYQNAAGYLEHMTASDDFVPFLTSELYGEIA